MLLNKNCFRFEIFNGRFPCAEGRKDYITAYNLWHQVWSQTFKEVDGAENLYSNDFTRQNEIGALFYNDEVVSVIFLNHIDLHLESHINDSYFSTWPKDLISEFKRDGVGEIVILSYLAQSYKWRQSEIGLPIKYVIFGLFCKKLIHSKVDLMISTTRNQRGINRVCYEFGAEPVRKNILLHGEHSDIVGFYKNNVHPCGISEIDEIVEVAWARGRFGQRIIGKNNSTQISTESSPRESLSHLSL